MVFKMTLSIILFISIVIASFSSGSLEDARGRLLAELECDEDETLFVDDDCVVDAEEVYTNTLQAAKDIFERSVDKAETKARRILKNANAKLRKKTARKRLNKKCRRALKVNRCKRTIVRKELQIYEKTEKKTLKQLNKEEEEAAEDRKAAKRAARRQLRNSQEECCECLPLSVRY